MLGLFDSDPASESLVELLLGELLDFLAIRSFCDKVNLCNVNKFLQDKVAATVTVKEDNNFFLPAQITYCLRDLGSIHCNNILETVLEKIQDVSTAFNNDDFFRVIDARACRAPVTAIFCDLHGSHCMRNFLSKFLRIRQDRINHSTQKFFCTFNNEITLADTHVFNIFDFKLSIAWTNALNDFQCSCNNSSFCLVKRRRDNYASLSLSAARLSIDLNTANPT